MCQCNDCKCKDSKKEESKVLITEDATLSSFGFSQPSTPVQQGK